MISSNTAFDGSSTFGQPSNNGASSHNSCSIPYRSRGYTRSGILARFFATVRSAMVLDFRSSDSLRRPDCGPDKVEYCKHHYHRTRNVSTGLRVLHGTRPDLGSIASHVLLQTAAGRRKTSVRPLRRKIFPLFKFLPR